jgi:lipoic acid synthetase
VQVADSRRPLWLRKNKPITSDVLEQKRRIARSGLHTVCESARCPNLSECFATGNATFLILGELCTRDCGFCAVRHGAPSPPDPGEGERIAACMRDAGVRYAVITSVTRDDLEDGGAGHFAWVVREVKRGLPEAGLELLVPDFKGDCAAVDLLMELPIEVFGHNVETVGSLYSKVRRGAEFGRSLKVLRRAAEKPSRRVLVKSGVMVGLGETMEELRALFDELAGVGVDMLTIGQYLQPEKSRVPVSRYLRPEEFDALSDLARSRGILEVFSGPFVRSSYLAEISALRARGAERLKRGIPRKNV